MFPIFNKRKAPEGSVSEEKKKKTTKVWNRASAAKPQRTVAKGISVACCGDKSWRLLCHYAVPVPMWFQRRPDTRTLHSHNNSKSFYFDDSLKIFCHLYIYSSKSVRCVTQAPKFSTQPCQTEMPPFTLPQFFCMCGSIFVCTLILNCKCINDKNFQRIIKTETFGIIVRVKRPSVWSTLKPHRDRNRIVTQHTRKASPMWTLLQQKLPSDKKDPFFVRFNQACKTSSGGVGGIGRSGP